MSVTDGDWAVLALTRSQAAGVCALIKTPMMLQSRQIPPQRADEPRASPVHDDTAADPQGYGRGPSSVGNVCIQSARPCRGRCRYMPQQPGPGHGTLRRRQVRPRQACPRPSPAGPVDRPELPFPPGPCVLGGQAQTVQVTVTLGLSSKVADMQYHCRAADDYELGACQVSLGSAGRPAQAGFLVRSRMAALKASAGHQPGKQAVYLLAPLKAHNMATEAPKQDADIVPESATRTTKGHQVDSVPLVAAADDGEARQHSLVNILFSIVAREVGVDFDLAVLEIDSLMAIAIISVVHKETGVELPGTFFLEQSTTTEARAAIDVLGHAGIRENLSIKFVNKTV